MKKEKNKLRSHCPVNFGLEAFGDRWALLILRDIIFITEKVLDLIPLIFEIVLWSAKYDTDSEAKRIVRLVDLIRDDIRKISRKVIEQVRRGEAIVAEYL